MLIYLIFLFSPGTTAHQFLELGFGARAVAMGEAYTAVSDDVYTIFYNPVGLRTGKDFSNFFTISFLVISLYSKNTFSFLYLFWL
jgi:hypothetical protein